MREQFKKNVVISPNSIRSLRCRGKYNMMSFKEFTDITKLHTLDVGYLDGARDIVSLLAQWQSEDLPELKHLSFALNDSAGVGVYDLMSDFLKTCSPLESLSIKDGANYIPLSAVLSQKATLRTLVLHEVESASSDVGRSMSIEEVKWSGESCEELEDITIDAGKISTGDGLNEILSTLATFPLLHTIRLYIPLGVADEASRTPHIFLDEDETRAEIEAHRMKPFNPIEDSGWLENAWSLLRHEKNKIGSRPLKGLHVKVGEWEREMTGGYPAGWVIWEASNRRYFTATPQERDDRPDDIYVCIRGTEPYSNVDTREVRRIPEFVDPLERGESLSDTDHKKTALRNFRDGIY
jgi:hypothetical protein